MAHTRELPWVLCDWVIPCMWSKASELPEHTPYSHAGFDHVQEIVSIVFDYIRIVKEQGVTEERWADWTTPQELAHIL